MMSPVLSGNTGGDEPIFDANARFPADIVRLNSAGEQSALVFGVGQFHGGAQMQRRYSALDVTAYYNYTDDREPPHVLTVESGLNGGNTVTVVASDTSGSHAVIVAYNGGDGN